MTCTISFPGDLSSQPEVTHVDSGENFAVKLEYYKTWPGFLEDEYQYYKTLYPAAGVPRVHEYLVDCKYRAMIIDLLGPSLEDLFNFCSCKFSLKTVLMLADQLLCRLQYIHSKNIIHQDVKPSNCLMGVGKLGNMVYVTDLGLAAAREKERSARSSGLVGTMTFSSIDGHLGNGEF